MSNDANHPRTPAGSPDGGKFANKPGGRESDSLHRNEGEARRALAAMGVRPAMLARLSDADTHEVDESFDFPKPGAVDVTDPDAVRATVAGYICARDETRFDGPLDVDRAREIAEETARAAAASVKYVRDQDARLIAAQDSSNSDDLVDAYLETRKALTDMVDARHQSSRAYWDLQVISMDRGHARSLMHPSEPEDVRVGVAGALKRLDNPDYRGQVGI